MRVMQRWDLMDFLETGRYQRRREEFQRRPARGDRRTPGNAGGIRAVNVRCSRSGHDERGARQEHGWSCMQSGARSQQAVGASSSGLTDARNIGGIGSWRGTWR